MAIKGSETERLVSKVDVVVFFGKVMQMLFLMKQWFLCQDNAVTYCTSGGQH
jgi:hypothetical protein